MTGLNSNNDSKIDIFSVSEVKGSVFSHSKSKGFFLPVGRAHETSVSSPKFDHTFYKSSAGPLLGS